MALATAHTARRLPFMARAVQLQTCSCAWATTNKPRSTSGNLSRVVGVAVSSLESAFRSYVIFLQRLVPYLSWEVTEMSTQVISMCTCQNPH